MSLINGLVDRHPVNVVHMCTVHRGAEESTPAFQQHCGGSFLREKESKKREEGAGRKEVGAEKREWNFEAFGSCCCKGEWMRAGAVQPATWAVLTRHNGGLSVVLNPLVARWERAAVRPPLLTDTLRHAHPLDNWILHPGKSPPSLGSVLTARGPDSNSPRINISCRERLWVRPSVSVRNQNIKRKMVLWCEGMISSWYRLSACCNNPYFTCLKASNSPSASLYWHPLLCDRGRFN